MASPLAPKSLKWGSQRGLIKSYHGTNPLRQTTSSNSPKEDQSSYFIQISWNKRVLSSLLISQGIKVSPKTGSDFPGFNPLDQLQPPFLISWVSIPLKASPPAAHPQAPPCFHRLAPGVPAVPVLKDGGGGGGGNMSSRCQLGATVLEKPLLSPFPDGAFVFKVLQDGTFPAVTH